MEKSFTQEDVKNNIERLTNCFPQLSNGVGMFRNIAERIAENYEKLAFPNHPNWTYCIPIIPNYTTKDGRVLDLGIHIEEDSIEKYGTYLGISANFVSSNEGPDYQSGNLRLYSEQSKITLMQLRMWDIIDDTHIMKALCYHNNFLDKFMGSDLTSWDLQDWLEEQTA